MCDHSNHAISSMLMSPRRHLIIRSYPLYFPPADNNPMLWKATGVRLSPPQDFSLCVAWGCPIQAKPTHDFFRRCCVTLKRASFLCYATPDVLALRGEASPHPTVAQHAIVVCCKSVSRAIQWLTDKLLVFAMEHASLAGRLTQGRSH